jgi:hypothetical protein
MNSGFKALCFGIFEEYKGGVFCTSSHEPVGLSAGFIFQIVTVERN